MLGLRPYRDGDRDVVVQLWWDSWHSIRPGLRHPRGFDDLRARWSSEIVPRQNIVVAEEDGAVVGFAAADLGSRAVTQVFTAPARRPRVFGHHLVAWAQGLMPDGFILHTLVDNAASRAFYE